MSLIRKMNRQQLERQNRSKQVQGFTIIELLVTITIVLILAALFFAGGGRFLESAKKVKELSAGRTLGTALNLYAAENFDSLPYGFDGTVSYLPLLDSSLSLGAVHGAAASRYPWRLAQYFAYDFKSTTVLDDKQESFLNDPYMLSLVPSLGMNAYGVGGYIEEGASAAEPFPGAIRRAAAAHKPASMVSFVSTRIDLGDGSGMTPGFHLATPPKTPGGDWRASYDPDDADSFGNVDLRYGGKAVVVFLDGSTDLMTGEQLRDMRLWNNEAAALDDASYRPVDPKASQSLSRPTSGGRPRR
ncbi:MAG: type II secretion system protein [Verrucomicrobiota bacterium]